MIITILYTSNRIPYLNFWYSAVASNEGQAFGGEIGQ